MLRRRASSHGKTLVGDDVVNGKREKERGGDDVENPKKKRSFEDVVAVNYLDRLSAKQNEQTRMVGRAIVLWGLWACVCGPCA